MKHIIKHILLLTATIILTLTLFLPSVNAQTYHLDTKKSAISWTGYGEIGGFSQEGTIKAKSGSLTMSMIAPSDSAVAPHQTIAAANIIIDMNTMKSENKRVADHLKNEDFFYVKQYPTATLNLRCMVGDSLLQADLTIRGVTHAIDIPITLTITNQTVKAQGAVRIDRTLHGIKYNSSSFFKSLGNQAIKNEFDLSFDLLFKVVE